MRQGVLGVLAAVVLLVGCRAPGDRNQARAGALPGVDSLVIIHTNDVHSHLDAFEVAGGEIVGGAAARAIVLSREKARGGRVLVLDAGDLVQGTPYYNRFRGEPDHRILDLLGYDAIALGNHDLDDGAEAWRARAAVTKTPILCANVLFDVRSPLGRNGAAGGAGGAAPGDRPRVPASIAKTAKWIGGGKVPRDVAFEQLARPYMIFERGGVRIAVLGLMTYSLDRIVAARHNGGVAVASPVATAHYYVPLLRKQADIVVALTHLGVDQDRWLVDHVPGIDVVIGGHSHTALFRPRFEKAEGGRATPITQAGAWGRYVGRTTLRWAGDRIRMTTSRLFEVHPSDGEDPGVSEVVASYRVRLGSQLDEVVARLPERIEITDRRDGDHPLGNFVADVMRERTGADIGVMNAGGIRAPLPAGDVRERDILSMLPFDNRLMIVSLTGSDVRRLLDRFAARVGKQGFGHVSGLSYTVTRDRATEIRLWDPATPGRWRGRSSGPGIQLDPERVYKVATIDFLAEGGDYFDELREATERESTDVLLSDAAITFLRDHPGYKFGRDGRVQWRASGETFRDMRVH